MSAETRAEISLLLTLTGSLVMVLGVLTWVSGHLEPLIGGILALALMWAVWAFVNHND